MSLKEKLLETKKGFLAKVPQAVVDTMGAANEEVAATGILEKVLGEGSTAPEFELENQAGAAVKSSELLTRGPLVLSFYRGKW